MGAQVPLREPVHGLGRRRSWWRTVPSSEHERRDEGDCLRSWRRLARSVWHCGSEEVDEGQRLFRGRSALTSPATHGKDMHESTIGAWCGRPEHVHTNLGVTSAGSQDRVVGIRHEAAALESKQRKVSHQTESINRINAAYQRSIEKSGRLIARK